MKCRSCFNKELDLVLDLGNHAWCNNFISAEMIGKENTYPLRMVHCKRCDLAQLDYTVPKETMFADHTYVSGTTKTLAKHFYEVASEASSVLNENDYILDIGGNDGTNLLQYAKLGFNNVENVESAKNIAKLSSQAGIKTYNAFFNQEFVDENGLSNRYKLINASGVFFHLEELHSVIEGIKKSLTDDGVFIVQFMYLGDILKQLSFDSVYHEHLCYYSIKSLINLLTAGHGMTIFDAYRSDIHGGSIIAKFCKSQFYERSDRLQELLSVDSDLVTQEKLYSYQSRIEKWRDDFVKKIDDIRENGNKVYVFGAPAKGNTLLTYCGLDKDKIEYVFEVNDMKCGLYTPVTHIPIIKENHSIIDDNSYIILLSWNFAEEIIGKCQDLLDRGVKFILPFTGDHDGS